MSKLRIEYVPIDSIKPYENNAKIHTGEQIEQIKKSINEFSMNDPIGIWHNQIVEGHGRWIACKELGINTVPVIRLDNLTDEQRKAYALIHNKLTMNTDFDNDIVEIELDEISNIDMEQFGFEIEDFEIDENNLDDDTQKTKVNVSIVFNNNFEFEEAKERLENIANEFNTNLSIKML